MACLLPLQVASRPGWACSRPPCYAAGLKAPEATVCRLAPWRLGPGDSSLGTPDKPAAQAHHSTNPYAANRRAHAPGYTKINSVMWCHARCPKERKFQTSTRAQPGVCQNPKRRRSARGRRRRRAPSMSSRCVPSSQPPAALAGAPAVSKSQLSQGPPKVPECGQPQGLSWRGAAQQGRSGSRPQIQSRLRWPPGRPAFDNA